LYKIKTKVPSGDLWASMRTSIIVAMILLAALTRLLPHPFNFTAVTAMGLFGAAYFRNEKHFAFIVPILAMIVSDICLEFISGYGFHSGTWLVYSTFTLVIAFGLFILRKVNLLNVVLASLGGSIFFFLITNFAFLYPASPVNNPALGQYTHDFQGIIASYTAGLPFFKNAIVGDLFYSGLLFGAFELAKKFYKPLQTA
jgi:hypothetical protein